ncbi:bifunctional oligoribonuclease/PAP phosphatase NrnA [Limosilactobacillus mucosae]|uniref:DHH family phosphoesterase n=1 Tax=Limosilactobacillus TaxID=2742598 RepID=UPI00233F3D64|nr:MULTISPECIES: bifunctional oligoribonuclease/PAP phosphatase NrnA [Limosilactobacillus]MDD6454043.1 bifunctional oligoribonuclease/PAP phosphatase NrnA [Lactobacillus sp.]MDC2838843.1 bifunctional oligoribonuclease/PAP phosphatase NrnA [Limosilactobacillus mucosae]MDC2841969.1 bifunctional oligoribonuclease/PAP phosphatase NrnA [Limosilactobacillus mucosae]MDC2845801.1 bifunctional oligoribonuclease/PAP phosphatase NrnA [Limosilactobacillus mucosae]MDD6865638.1 bifunctional oligoribonucleas
MDELASILEQIKKYNKIIIHRHQRPDPDAIGSQVGLAEILKASFPYKQVYVVGKHIPGFDWIGTMDEIEGDAYDDALVIVTDTANAPRIDDRRFNNGDELIKIDHHPNDEPYGDLMWVRDDASSCSEMIYEFYEHFKKELTLPKKAAHALYAGIVGDTGRFLYPATTPNTMRIAGELMAAGADASAICQREDTITLPLARLSAYVYENMTLLESGAAYVILTNEILKRYGLTEAGTSAVVPLPGKIQGVKAWAIFVQQEDGHYRIRLRSKGPFINELAKKHQGGGHPLASGAKARDEQEIKAVVSQLDELAANA